jgi:hypothetical protein
MISAYDTIAEVSVAVVGFVAIVAAISRERLLTDLEHVLMQNVLFEPIAVVMFALLPQVVASSGLGEKHSLQFSMVVFAVAHLYLSYWVFIRFRPHFGLGMPKAFTLTLILIPVALCLVQLTSVVLVLPIPVDFLYLLGLY